MFCPRIQCGGVSKEIVARVKAYIKQATQFLYTSDDVQYNICTRKNGNV